MPLPFISQYPADKIPNRQTMTAEQFADAVHPYLNFWNDTTIPQVNAWRESLEQIRQDINAKHDAVMNQAIDGGYSQAYLDNKFGQIWNGLTFYVDAVNGDDANNGSSGSPFRTIKKAVESVPMGGAGKIYIKSDEVIVDSTISLLNKSISFIKDTSSDANPKIKFKVAYNSSNDNLYVYAFGTEYVSHFYNVGFWYVDIGLDWSDVPSDKQDKDFNHYYMGIFPFGYDGVSINRNIVFFKSNITLNKQIGLVVGLQSRKFGWMLSGGFTSLQLGMCSLNLSDNAYILDATGNNALHVDNVTGWSNDYVLNVVKDSNGVPRNIISNIIF